MREQTGADSEERSVSSQRDRDTGELAEVLERAVVARILSAEQAGAGRAGR